MRSTQHHATLFVAPAIADGIEALRCCWSGCGQRCRRFHSTTEFDADAEAPTAFDGASWPVLERLALGGAA
jgi:hypothetical protein